MILAAGWKRAVPIAVLVLPLLVGLSSTAAAQAQSTAAQTSAQAKTDQKVTQAEAEGVVRTKEEVTVTGTMLPRKDLEALSPVTVVDAQEVTYAGTGRVEDLVQQMPQVFAAQNASISNGASGTATVALRQLGSVRTLSLINGRRMASGDAYETAADLNFIPSALVKRVDILTGGASSVYGADAMAGVVNFVMDTEFQGFRGEVQWNGFQHNNSNQLARDINSAKGFTVPTGSTWDNGGYNVNLAVGGKFDGGKGSASAYVDYRDDKAIWKDRRDYTNCSVSSLGGLDGPVCGGSSTWQYGRFFTDTGDFVLDTTTGNTFRNRTSSDVFNYAPYNFMQRNDTRWSGGGFARYTINEKIEPYAEVMMMNDYSDAQIAPSGDFFSTTEINCDNPMLSEQQRNLICTVNGYGPTDIAYLNVGRRNVEGGNRTDQLQHTNWRLLAGVRGDLSPAWNYDMYGMNAQVNAPDVYINDFLSTRIQNSLIVDGIPGDPSTWQCRDANARAEGCVPWDIFKSGGVTTAATDYLNVPYLYNSGTNTKMFGATLKGDLGRSDVKFPTATEGIQVALGVELRKESVFISPDYIRANGLGAGSGGPTNPVDGSYKTNEVFGEARVPFVQDRSGMQDLSLELGYRFARYTALGQESKNDSSYKGILSWAPVQGLRLRGGFSRAVRAPNVRELFAPQSVQLSGTTDICAGTSPSATLAECQRTGVTAAQYGHIVENPASQYNSLTGGNPQLNVETGNTWTAGVVLTPKSITGLTVTADYYDIKIENLISSLFADDTIQACANTGDPQLCSLIHRDSRGTLWLTPDGYTVSTNQNIGSLRSRGIDIGFTYPWNLGDAGFITFSLLGTTMFENRLTTPLVDYDCVGYYGNQCGIPSPKWRHRVRATWNTKFNASFTLGWRFINHVLIDDASPDADLANAALIPRWQANGSYENPAYNWLDFAVGYRIKEKINLTVGCNNILDKEPPLGSGVSPNDYGPGMYGTYDYLGRALYANMKFEF
jgi:iron complex outermembrane receptor protein